MHCDLWVIPTTGFPIEEEFPVDDLYQVHECCGQHCDQYKEGVSKIDTSEAEKRMPDYPRNSWSLNNHTFWGLDEKTGGLLQEVVGDYETNICLRLVHLREELKQLRVIADAMETGNQGIEHCKAFLNILVDCAEDAIQKYGEQAAISNS